MARIHENPTRTSAVDITRRCSAGAFLALGIFVVLMGFSKTANGASATSTVCVSRTRTILTLNAKKSCEKSETLQVLPKMVTSQVCVNKTSAALSFSISGLCSGKTVSIKSLTASNIVLTCTNPRTRSVTWRKTSRCASGLRSASLLLPVATSPLSPTFVEASPSTTLAYTTVPTTTSSTTTTTTVPSTTSTSTTTSTTQVPNATSTSSSSTSTSTSTSTTSTSTTTTTTIPGPPPTASIYSFVVADATINKGSSTDLSASFDGQTASINQSVGSISDGGHITVSPTSTTTYTLTVTDAYNTSVTQSVTVYVNSVSIVVQPQGMITSSEAGSFFSVGASGVGTLSYQWLKNNVLISGATSGTYRVTENGDYTVVVTSTYRGITMSQTSQVASYLVNSASITLQPTSTSILLGNAHTFSVDATGSGALSYQWFIDGVAIDGATSRTVTTSTQGTYKVQVTSTLSGNARTIDSNSVVLTINGATITGISNATYVTQGSSKPIGVAVSIPGGVTVTYQWQLNGSNVSGAISQSINATQNGDYTAIVTSSRNGATKVQTSGAITVSVVPLPSITSFDSLYSSISLGSSTDLVPVFANGTGVINPGNIAVTSGDHVTVSPLVSTTYTLVVTNPAGSTGGMTYTITVTTGTFSSASNVSSTSRYHDSTSITLSNGKVLVFGNHELSGTTTTDVYDPTTNTFTRTGDTNVGRRSTPGVLLANGKVLIAGGGTWVSNDWASTKSAELFDPATGTWSLTGDMAVARRDHFMVRLNNGKVLIGGGTNSVSTRLQSVELYDPVTGTFSSMPDMPETRTDTHAALLPNGNVIVIGGFSTNGLGHLTSAIIFDVSTNTWSSVTSQMQSPHDYGSAVVTLNDGRILIAGGWTSDLHGISRVDIFDPSTNTFTAGPSLTQLRADLTAHVLTDGKVVLIGGADGYGSVWNSVDVYDPATSRIVQQVNTMSYGRYAHSSALLADGRILIVGGTYSGQVTAELFTE